MVDLVIHKFHKEVVAVYQEDQDLITILLSFTEVTLLKDIMLVLE